MKKINIDRPLWSKRLVLISGQWFFVGDHNLMASAHLMPATITAIEGHEEVLLS